MKVEVDIPVDEIVRNSILEDWNMINKDIERMKHSKTLGTLQKYESEDYKNWKKIRKALKVMIGYYFPYDEAENIVGKKKGY